MENTKSKYIIIKGKTETKITDHENDEEEADI